jgi:polyhydroxyalkanoate synthesis regulator phasin
VPYGVRVLEVKCDRRAYGGALLLVAGLVAGICLTGPLARMLESPSESAEDAGVAVAPGIDLPADWTCPNLKTTSAEEPARYLGAAPQTERDHAEAEVSPARGSAADRSVDAPMGLVPVASSELSPGTSSNRSSEALPPVEPAVARELALPEPPRRLPDAIEAVALPVGPAPVPSAQFGETPMMRTWRMLGLQAVLATAVVAPVGASGQGPEKTPDKTDNATLLKKLDEIDKNLRLFDQNVAKDMDDLKKKVELSIQNSKRDVEDLRKEMAQLRQDVEALRKGTSGTSSAYGSTKDFEELRKQLDKLQQTLDALRAGMGTNVTAMRPVAPRNGRIVLDNSYPQQIDFIVNERVYTLPPFMTRELELPVGSTFTFRVPAVPAYANTQSRVLGATTPHVIQVR